MKNKKLLLLCVGLLMTTQMIFAQVPSYVPTNGLVGYWPFNGNANDQSGNGNNGTVNGATITTDRLGNENSAYDFNGVNDVINLGNVNYINSGVVNEFTISIWVNLNRYNDINNGEQAMIIGDEISQNNGTILQIHSSYGFGTYTAGSSGYYCNCIPNLNSWVNYVIIQKNNGQYLFINGQLWGQLTSELNSEVNTPIRCGLFDGCSGACQRALKGKLDDIGIWNRALTEQEITNLYNANQCINTITVTDTLIINVGQLSFINPIVWANNITIAPNPASTQVNISFNNVTDLTGGTIKIMNSLGQQVATTPITATGTNTTMALNSWGGTGLYFVQIVNAQGQIVDIKKIILQ